MARGPGADSFPVWFRRYQPAIHIVTLTSGEVGVLAGLAFAVPPVAHNPGSI
jgi:hypothetical protein